MLALSDGERGAGAPAREAWLDATAARLDDLPALDEPRMLDHGEAALAFALRRGREHYLANIETCKRLLEAGESYEICLTNTLALPALGDPFELYRVLRRVNPAPYSAYLRMREGTVLSSSPERFLRVDARPHGRGQADQGHRPPPRRSGRRHGRPRRAGTQPEGARRAPHDRRPAAQRPRPRVADRQRPRAQAHGRRELRDRPPARLDDPRAPARRTSTSSTRSARRSPAAR